MRDAPTIGTTAEGVPIELDLDHILSGRMLLQANSGWGKSWALRRLLEQTADRGVQQLVLDWEGEFGTLREQHEYLLCGATAEADIRIDVRSARLLARKLLELGTSAVLDLSELEVLERIRFVSAFVTSLLGVAPRHYSQLVMVVIDEAQVMAPQSIIGSREMKDAVGDSTQTIINLASQGRKRGLAAIVATQRIARLDKSVAAECNSKLIGHASLQNDLVMAANELGLPASDRNLIRDLLPGEFYVFGAAFAGVQGVEKVTVGPVMTTHPTPTTRRTVDFHPPPLTKALADVITALADLPEIAEEEEQDLAALQRANRTLTATNKRLEGDVERARSEGGTSDDDVQALLDQETQELRAQMAEMRAVSDQETKDHRERLDEVLAIVRRQEAAGDVLRTVVAEQVSRMAEASNALGDALSAGQSAAATIDEQQQAAAVAAKGSSSRAARDAPTARPSSSPRRRAAPSTSSGGDGVVLTKAEGALLAVLAQFPDGRTRQQLAFLAGYSVRASTFRNALGRLRALGFADGYKDEPLRPTPAGLATADVETVPAAGDALYRHWLDSKLSLAEKTMLEVLHDAHPRELSYDEIAERSAYSRAASTFRNALGRLRSLELVAGFNPVVAADALFD